MLFVFSITLFAGFQLAIYFWDPELKTEESSIQSPQYEDETNNTADYFPRTGHWVSGPFWEKYYDLPNPERLYGEPITPVFRDTATNLAVQYFEKVRFEYHPSNPPGERVKISPIGSFLYQPGSPIIPDSYDGCEFFDETNVYLCFDFLNYFYANGGLDQFGYPISNFESHDGLITQYFEKARLEWRPEFGDQDAVYVSNLGTSYFHYVKEDPNFLDPTMSNAINVSAPTDLNINIFTDSPIIFDQDTITLFTIVQDQNLLPVHEAIIVLQLDFPNGESQLFYPGVTDKTGINSLEIFVHPDQGGIVQVTAAVGYGDLMKEIRSSIHINTLVLEN